LRTSSDDRSYGGSEGYSGGGECSVRSSTNSIGMRDHSVVVAFDDDHEVGGVRVDSNAASGAGDPPPAAAFAEHVRRSSLRGVGFATASLAAGALAAGMASASPAASFALFVLLLAVLTMVNLGS
jgi:hypothetical protein